MQIVLPFEYQTNGDLINGQQYNYSDAKFTSLNNRPLCYNTQVRYLNTILVLYLDPHCTLPRYLCSN